MKEVVRLTNLGMVSVNGRTEYELMTGYIKEKKSAWEAGTMERK